MEKAENSNSQEWPPNFFHWVMERLRKYISAQFPESLELGLGNLRWGKWREVSGWLLKTLLGVKKRSNFSVTNEVPF